MGLAAHAPLPALLGRLTESVANVLEMHTTGLVVGDANAARERDVYLQLVGEHRQAARELRAIADHMASCRDLPLGAHDVDALSAPNAVQVFKSFVDIEHELVELLERRLEEDRQLLDSMVSG
jgi:hypothetical protein